jgi:hypothetical protein
MRDLRKRRIIGAFAITHTSGALPWNDVVF